MKGYKKDNGIGCDGILPTEYKCDRQVIGRFAFIHGSTPGGGLSPYRLLGVRPDIRRE